MNAKEIIKKHYAKIGRKGGTNRMASITRKEREELSAKALAARWKKNLGKIENKT